MSQYTAFIAAPAVWGHSGPSSPPAVTEGDRHLMCERLLPERWTHNVCHFPERGSFIICVTGVHPECLHGAP